MAGGCSCKYGMRIVKAIKELSDITLNTFIYYISYLPNMSTSIPLSADSAALSFLSSFFYKIFPICRPVTNRFKAIFQPLIVSYEKRLLLKAIPEFS